MTREKSTYPFADLVAAFFRIWPRTREVERISSWEFSKSSQAIIALASSWLGISWGVFVAYTIGRESIEAWTLALVLVLLIGTHAYFFYALPRMLDTLSEKIGKIGDAAIMKLISEEMNSISSADGSAPLEPLQPDPESPSSEDHNIEHREVSV